jgi:signal transduction histidine kinase
LARTTDATTRLTQLIQDSSERLGRIISELKQFVSLDQSERRLFDVRQGLDSAITLLKPSLGEQIDIVRLYDVEHAMVNCYPAKLNQVFINLLKNASAAIDSAGQIRVRLRGAEGSVEIRIEDDGRGIAQDRLATLFDFGFTEKAGRMALRMGLPSSKQTVEEVDGQIEVQSQPGSGTTVTLRLPRVDTLPEAAPSTPQHSAVARL